MRATPLHELLGLLAEAKPKEVEAIYHFARGLRQGVPSSLREAIRAGGSAPEAGGGPDYLIRQESTRRRAGKQDRTQVSTWRIWFRSEEVLMPPWLGTEYLVFLIRKQRREFDAGALTQAVRKIMPVRANVSGHTVSEILHGQAGAGDQGEPVGGRVGDLAERDVIWDERQIAQCLQALEELPDEIRLHEEAGDFSSDEYQALKAALEEQRDLLRSCAKQVQGKWVPKEYQKGTFQEKADVIRKHVRKLLDEHLYENCRPFYDHLNDRNTLVYGVRNRYRPVPPIKWKFQTREGTTGI